MNRVSKCLQFGFPASNWQCRSNKVLLTPYSHDPSTWSTYTFKDSLSMFLKKISRELEYKCQQQSVRTFGSAFISTVSHRTYIFYKMFIKFIEFKQNKKQNKCNTVLSTSHQISPHVYQCREIFLSIIAYSHRLIQLICSNKRRFDRFQFRIDWKTSQPRIYI